MVLRDLFNDLPSQNKRSRVSCSAYVHRTVENPGLMLINTSCPSGLTGQPAASITDSALPN